MAILRCGIFYAADAGHTRFIAERLRWRLLPIVGSGDAVWTMLHADEAASAFAAAVGQDHTGLWHVTDNVPVTAADFLRAFAETLGAPPPRRVPVWLARLLAGDAVVKFFTRSIRTSNERFVRDYGWVATTFRRLLLDPHAILKPQGEAAANGFPGIQKVKLRNEPNLQLAPAKSAGYLLSYRL